MDAAELKRLKWQCRRGLLELDLVLERFLAANPDLHNHEMQSLYELLDAADKDLLDIVMGRSERYAPHLNEIVARLRAA